MKVKVKVDNLSTDINGEEVRYRKGDTFEVAADSVEKLGRSVVVLEKDSADTAGPVPPDTKSGSMQTKKSTKTGK